MVEVAEDAAVTNIRRLNDPSFYLGSFNAIFESYFFDIKKGVSLK